MDFNFNLREAPPDCSSPALGVSGREGKQLLKVWSPTTCFHLLFTNTEHLQCPEVTLTGTWITGLSHTGGKKREMRIPEPLFFFVPLQPCLVTSCPKPKLPLDHTHTSSKQGLPLYLRGFSQFSSYVGIFSL